MSKGRKLFLVFAAVLALMVGCGTMVGGTMISAAALCETPGGVDVGADLAPGQQGDEANPAYVWRALRAAGLPAQAVAGIMGNLAQESGPNINPRLIEGNGKGPGTGIAQWGNNGGKYGSNRWNEKLVPWAKKKGLDEWELSTQVSFMLWEMTQYKHKGTNLLASMRKMTSIKEALDVFMRVYEGCGICMADTRSKYAQQFYNRFSKVSVTTLPTASVKQPAMSTAGSLPGASITTRVWPVGKKASIGARFGQAGAMWSSGYHTGLDFGASSGTQIKAAHSGKVSAAGWQGPYGNSIDLVGKFNGKTITTRYAHQSKLIASKGETVKAGQTIGLVGSTGNSTGPHLHFELLVNGKQTDPLTWLKAGAIDVPDGANDVPEEFDSECDPDSGIDPTTDLGDLKPNPNAGPGGGEILGTHPTLGNISAPVRHFTNSSHEYYNGGGRHSCAYDGKCMDLGTPLREPIYAMADGQLSQKGWSSAQSRPGMGFGMVSTIKHKDGTESVYAHLAAQVGSSRKVKAGELIALAGCTTGSRRPNVSCAKDGGYVHLHFEWSGLPKVSGGANPPFFTQWQTKCFQGQCDVEGNGRMKKKR